MTMKVLESPVHINGCVLDDPSAIDYAPLSNVCILDTPMHLNGGCILDNNLHAVKTRPFRKGWDWDRIYRDDDDIAVFVTCVSYLH